MKDGFHAIDSDLHIIETEEAYENLFYVLALATSESESWRAYGA